MQVRNSQQNFGGAKYSFNSRTNIPEITNGIRAAVDKVGEKHDVALKLKGAIKCQGGEHHCCDYVTTSKVVVSKANKSPFEKLLHFVGLLPKATVSSTFEHHKGISAASAKAQSIADTQKAMKQFAVKAK